MSTLQLFIKLETAENTNNNKTALLPFQQGFDKFFIDLKDAFDNKTNPVFLIKFAKETDVPAIALCYALYKENLTPGEVSYNANNLETIVNVITMDTTVNMVLNEISQRIKKEVVKLTSNRESNFPYVKDLKFEIKNVLMEKPEEKSDLDAQSSSSGVSTQHDEPCYQLAAELDLNDKNRLFLACKNCYALKPPIVIHQHKDTQECSWCENNATTLLHEETYTVDDDKFVEYSVVRKYDDEREVEECKNNFSASCIDGDNCRYAHSPDEKKLWEFVKENSQSWDELTSIISQCFPKVETTNGVFHCAICRENFNSGQDFSHHCDGLQHKQMSRCVDGKLKWKYRLPPNLKAENHYLCHHIEKDNECPDGDSCPKAHSPEELDEWNKRVKIIRDKQKFARENKLLSFPVQISQEFDEKRSTASVLSEVMDEVKCSVRPNVKHIQHCRTNGIVEWQIKLNSLDTQNKLSHVALLQRHENDFFKFCKVRGKKKGQFTSHIDYTMATDDTNNLLHGVAKFRVKFSAAQPGTFSDVLVFEFRKCPRPALMVKFQVFVGDKISFLPERPKPSQHISWENRPIVDFKSENQNEFEGIMKELIIKYKAPEVALDYKEDGKDLDSKNLTAENYVDEMHRFLYREEAARKKAISKAHCSCHIGLSENYFSMNGGLCFTDGKGGIFGIFQLPSNLTRDTDEGLLILENCQMVLLSKTDSDDSSTVYEAKIETVAADHAVLNISKNCVEAWNLQTGRVIECDVQFQLDRRLFCMSHGALDQLPELGRLSMVCPEPCDFNAPVKRNSVKSRASLDLQQNRVLDHLTSDNVIHPLFAVVGPFGTGKTYTISQCVLYLLENDPRSKILICTHSNTAADLYIQNNFTADEWEGKIIRVYYHDRSLNSVPLEVHRFCLKNEASTQFRYPNTKEILSDKVKIVITTFATALALGRLATGLTGAFTHIFLDEAAQAMECEAIIPLTLASTNNTKVIVAGDHMQISQKMYSKKFGSESHYTLVERMYTRYKTFPRNLHDSLYTFLTNNYRCVQPILYLIQEVFYKPGLLKACANEQLYLSGLNPVQFYHLKGKCVEDISSGGFYNMEEAERAVFVVDDVIRNSRGALEESDVVVVSSYYTQVKCIRNLMRAQRKSRVNVRRVRDVQGLEYKVVIMSCVHSRTSPQDTTGSKSGLLSDVGLLNTAITRSKVAVIAIGDAVTLCSVGGCHMRWDKYLRFCDLNRSLWPPNESYQHIKYEVYAISLLNPDAQGFVPRRRTSQKPRPSASSDIQQSAEDEDEFVDSDSNEDDDDNYEHEDSLARVDDKILDDILEKQLGYRPENIVVKVDRSGLEYLGAIKDDPNEPKPDLRNHFRKKTVIHQKFTLGQLQDLLINQPQKYKHCYLNMLTWYSAEAILKEPDEDLSRISLETRRSLGRAFNKDEVVVHVIRIPGRPTNGKVIGVLSRYKEPRSREFVCIPDQYNPMFMCPVDYKVAKFIVHREKGAKADKVCVYRFTAKETLKKLFEERVDLNAYTRGGGKLFIVRYLNWSEYSLYPYGYVAKVIKAAEAERYFAIAFDRPTEHKPQMEKKAEKLEDINSEIRKDCTNLYAFTIDPSGSKDLDDALSIAKCSQHTNCHVIGVHIADVASVVPFGSEVDKEARRRATTFYDPEIMRDNRKNSPMLPRILSSDKCSLLPEETRPAISTFFHTSKPLDVSDSGFDVPRPQLTKIRSRRQMNYKEAEDLLREARSNPQEDLCEVSDNTLSQQLYEIWRYLLELRFSRLGTSAFHHQPNSNKLDEFFDEASAHMLIEEAMITLNACTAMFLRKEKSDFLLRCQDIPLEEEWRGWSERYRTQIRLSLDLKSSSSHLGIDEYFLHSEPITKRKLNVMPMLLNNINEAMQRGDVDSALIYFSCDQLQPSICPATNGFIAMQKPATLKTSSTLSDHPASSHSHFQLRLPFYSWCSSPIRRYTDVIAQREIIKICKKGANDIRQNGIVTLDGRREKANINEICKQVSLRQSDAKEYEREMMRYSVAKLLQDQEERFYQQAFVTEITNKGIQFMLVNNKGLSKASTHLEYSPLLTKRSVWKEAENVKSSRPGEKILEQNELVWHLRFYVIQGQDKGFVHSHFDRTVVPVKPVLELVNFVSTAINSGSTFGDVTTNEIKEHLRRVIKTQRKEPRCSRRAGGQSGPCYDTNCDRKESGCGDHMSFRTKNNIRHVRVISMAVDQGFPLLVQLNPKIHRGMLQPTVQLLCLADDLDVCLTHQSDAVGTFAYDVKPVNLKGMIYDTMEDYANAWLPLLRLDGVHNAVKEAMSVTYSGVAIAWKTPGVKGKFSLNSRFCDERMIDIHPDGFVCIRVKNRPSRNKGGHFTWVAHALITKVKDKKDVLEISFKICNSLLSNVDAESSVYASDTLWTIEHIQLQAPHKRMAYALHEVMRMDETKTDPIKQFEIARMLCIEKRPESWFVDFLTRKVNNVLDSVGKKVKGFSFSLNQVQTIHVRQAMGNKLSLIQGPPGTGKSLTGAYMVYYFRQMNKATGNDGLIMYCGPSNKAADVVADYLLKCGLRILRVYGKMMEELDYPNPLKPKVGKQNQQNPSRKLDSITLHKIIRKSSNSRHLDIHKYDKMFQIPSSEVTIEDYEKYQNLVAKAKGEELRRHDVIICTCTGAAMTTLRSLSYSHCIIDEAGMCSEPETLVPVVASDAKQVVLIGDHQQLQPVIQCDRAREFGMGVSMFERLHEEAKMLTIQYRMNQTICRFPSDHFYHRQLDTDISVVQRELTYPGVMEYPVGKYPRNTAIFAHMETEEDSSYNKFEHGGVNSKLNKGQAKAVVKILTWLHLTKKVPLDKIMILSPYNAQCYEITTAIKKEHSHFSSVHVGTVVTSQGSESDYVIFSTVRSPRPEEIDETAPLHWRRKYLGFVTDAHQVNVAITRAKSGLCIIGNSKVLEKDIETWEPLIGSYRARGSVVRFDSPLAPWNKL